MSSSREDHSGDGAAARHAEERPSLFAGAPLSEPGTAPSERPQLRTLTVQDDAPAAAAQSPPSKSAVVWAAFVLLLIAAMFFLLQHWSHEAFGPEAPRSLRAQQRHAGPAVDEASASEPAVIENVMATPAQAAPADDAPIQTERAAPVPAAGGTPVIGAAATATTGAARVPATGATGAPAAPTGAAPAPAPMPTAPEAPQRVPVSRESAAPNPNRDVVVRTPESSTEELLARCRKLGVLEGESCRFRICSGRWGVDAACPVTSQPTTAR